MRFADLLAAHPPDGLALVHGDERSSWAQLGAGIDAACGGVAERVGPGDVVVVLGGTSIAFVQTLLGALQAGATVLPLHPRNPRAELEHACALAQPRLVVDVDQSDVAASLGGEVVAAADLLSATPADPVDVDDDRPALLLFTSGTAGHPRLAMLSRRNLTASIESSIQTNEGIEELARVLLGVMPLTHVLGVVSVLGVALALGSTLVLPADPAPEAVAASVAAEGVTLLVAPPIFWFRLAESEVDESQLASVQLGLSGAAPLNGSLAARVEARFGLRLRQGYGLTEASPGLTSSVGTDAPATSVGRPMRGVELRLVDEFGNDALVGDVGEVWARGANVFLGYLGDEAATAEVLDDDGWLRTGDLAVVDEHGHLFIVGRSKDQIICAGFNVHPGEVEERLVQHPAVAAAAVVGEPDPEYGEVVVAHVVADGAVTAEELQAHCRSRLAGYKVPRRVEFADELPTGATGKLRRRMLRSG